MVDGIMFGVGVGIGLVGTAAILLGAWATYAVWWPLLRDAWQRRGRRWFWFGPHRCGRCDGEGWLR